MNKVVLLTVERIYACSKAFGGSLFDKRVGQAELCAQAFFRPAMSSVDNAFLLVRNKPLEIQSLPTAYRANPKAGQGRQRSVLGPEDPCLFDRAAHVPVLFTLALILALVSSS